MPPRLYYTNLCVRYRQIKWSQAAADPLDRVFRPKPAIASRGPAALSQEGRIALVTSDDVFDETVTTLKARAGLKASVAAGEVLLNSRRLAIEPVTDADRANGWQIFTRHGDKLWSFTDCTSRALIDHLGCDEVWSLDADFRQMGYRVRL